ncbi:MAG: choice-of-anchor B family protein [Phycisphaerae bacterium]
MSRCRVTLLAGVLVIWPALVWAHSDDPKARDRQPPYRGEGYRADLRGTPPDFPSSGITLLSWLPLSDFGPSVTSSNSCFGYVSPSGREYAIIGLSTGTGFVEVTNPGNAQIVAQVAGPNSLWRDMKVYQNYCYSVSEGGNGIQVIDMSQIDSGIVTLVREVTVGGTTTATHTLAADIDSGFLYRCGGGSNGLRIYSLATPSNPTFVSSWTLRYVHEAQIVTYTSGPYAGRQIAFCCTGDNGGFNNTGLEILDVTNKASIVAMSRTFWSNPGYSHQIWLTPDRQNAYLNDELDEQNFGLPTRTLTFAVSNLTTPTITGDWTNGNTAIGHNLYTLGNYIFEANYRSGLHVFDTSGSRNAPVEIAYFDTWPQDNLPQFNGLWNNYPYLPSGTIIGSDIEKGLFVWQLGTNSLAFTYPSGLPTVVSPAGQTLDVRVTPQGSAVMQGVPSFSVDSGAGFVTTSMTPLGGDLYRATFPASPCGTAVRFYASAQTTNNIVWTDPFNAPSNSNDALAAYGVSVALTQSFEANNGGWAIGTPNSATTGQWAWGDPVGTIAQPEDDHTASGVNCWFTGQGVVGGQDGANDVDGGETALQSSTIDLTPYGPDVRISYWRWYSNSAGGAPNEDVFTVSISNNNGSTWTNVEIVGPGGLDASGGWYQHEFRVADFVTPTAQMRMRFIASDLVNGSLVEAAVDDVEIRTVNCTPPNPCTGDLNADRTVNEADLGILLAAWQTTAAGDLNNDGQTNESDLGILLGAWGVTCP